MATGQYGTSAASYTAGLASGPTHTTYSYGTTNYGAPSVSTNTVSASYSTNPYAGQWTNTQYPTSYGVSTAPTGQSYTGTFTANPYSNVAANPGTYSVAGFDGGSAYGSYYSGSVGTYSVSTAPSGSRYGAYVSSIANPYANTSVNDIGTFSIETFSSGRQYTEPSDKYGSYLDRVYGSGNVLPTDAQGQTAYGRQREQINVESAETADKYRRELGRRMAQQGVAGSGIEQAAQRTQSADLEKARMARLGQVDVEELQAQERRESELLQMAGQGEARYDQLKETARQFDNQQDLRAWIQTTNLNDAERERVINWANNTRELYQKGELAYADLSMREKELAQDAWKFTNQIEFDSWAKSMDIDDKQADRIWQAVENERRDKVDIFKTIAPILASFDTIRLKDQIDQKTEIRKARADNYYNLGMAGTEIKPDQLSALEASDPLAYNAYMAGKSGKTYADYTFGRDALINYTNASILQFNPGDAGYQAAINGIYQPLLPAGTPLFGTQSGTGTGLSVDTPIPITPQDPKPIPVDKYFKINNTTLKVEDSGNGYYQLKDAEGNLITKNIPQDLWPTYRNFLKQGIYPLWNDGQYVASYDHSYARGKKRTYTADKIA